GRREARRERRRGQPKRRRTVVVDRDRPGFGRAAVTAAVRAAVERGGALRRKPFRERQVLELRQQAGEELRGDELRRLVLRRDDERDAALRLDAHHQRRARPGRLVAEPALTMGLPAAASRGPCRRAPATRRRALRGTSKGPARTARASRPSTGRSSAPARATARSNARAARARRAPAREAAPRTGGDAAARARPRGA